MPYPSNVYTHTHIHRNLLCILTWFCVSRHVWICSIVAKFIYLVQEHLRDTIRNIKCNTRVHICTIIFQYRSKIHVISVWRLIVLRYLAIIVIIWWGRSWGVRPNWILSERQTDINKDTRRVYYSQYSRITRYYIIVHLYAFMVLDIYAGCI